MSKIGTDLNRFKDILKKKVQNDLGKFIASENLISQKDGKIFKIPINSINLPRFTFGQKDAGGVGQGKGAKGDPMDGEPKSGKDKAGDDTADHDLTADFTPEELAQMLSEHLQLPKLEPKSKGSITEQKNKYNSISNVGNEGLKHFKKTYKESLKREISTGNYDPSNPKFIPQRSDRRYKSFSSEETPDVKAAIFYLLDCSGSMGDRERHIAKSQIFWTELMLKQTYPHLESIYIIHDTEAKVVSKDEFFKLSSAGGTKISPAYELVSDIIQSDFPYASSNNYVLHFSDGDNWEEDNEKAILTLKDKLLANINYFGFAEIKSLYGASGGFGEYIESNFAGQEKVILSKLDGEQDIMKSIKEFFSGMK